MFLVRSLRGLIPVLQSTIYRSWSYTYILRRCPPKTHPSAFAYRQGASSFNQALNFNTSRVKDMSWMFCVRPRGSYLRRRQRLPHAPATPDILTIYVFCFCSAGRTGV